MDVLPYRDKTPVLDPSVFLAPGAKVIGDVVVGAESSIWFGTVVRGDVFHIRIGARSNLQDNCVVHVRRNSLPCLIGNQVTVGHGAILHACTIDDLCLVGMGAVVMDGARIGKQSIVAAGALVTAGLQAPPRSLVLGSPARVRRSLTESELRELSASADNYVRLAAEYRTALFH